MTDKLTDAIDQLVQEKTFSLDALNAVGRLRDRAVAQEQQIRSLETLRESQGRAISDLQEQVRQLAEQEVGLRERERKVAEREAKAQQLEVETAVAVAKSETFGIVFNTIFRNTAVRERVVRNETQFVSGPHGAMAMPHMKDDTFLRSEE